MNRYFAVISLFALSLVVMHSNAMKEETKVSTQIIDCVMDAKKKFIDLEELLCVVENELKESQKGDSLAALHSEFTFTTVQNILSSLSKRVPLIMGVTSREINIWCLHNKSAASQKISIVLFDSLNEALSLLIELEKSLEALNKELDNSSVVHESHSSKFRVTDLKNSLGFLSIKAPSLMGAITFKTNVLYLNDQLSKTKSYSDLQSLLPTFQALLPEIKNYVDFTKTVGLTRRYFADVDKCETMSEDFKERYTSFKKEFIKLVPKFIKD